MWHDREACGGCRRINRAVGPDGYTARMARDDQRDGREHQTRAARRSRRLQAAGNRIAVVGVVVALVGIMIGALVNSGSSGPELRTGDQLTMPSGGLLVSESSEIVRLDFDIVNDTTKPIIIGALDIGAESLDESWCYCPDGCGGPSEITVDHMYALDDRDGGATRDLGMEYTDGNIRESGARMLARGVYTSSDCNGPTESLDLPLAVSIALPVGDARRLSITLPRNIEALRDGAVLSELSSSTYRFSIAARDSNGWPVVELSETRGSR